MGPAFAGDDSNEIQYAQINSNTPSTISTMPSASRGVVACLNANAEIACANSTSTSASVRTLAAVASAKARNQNCDASAPMNPANRDGRQARMIETSTSGLRSQR